MFQEILQGGSGGEKITQSYISSQQTLAETNTFNCGFKAKYIAFVITGTYPTSATNVNNGKVHDDTVFLESGGTKNITITDTGFTLNMVSYSSITHYIQAIAFG